MAEEEKKPTEAEAKEGENTSSKKETKDGSQKVEPNSAAVNNLRVLENIEVRLTVEVGNTEIKIKDLLRLNEGSVVELDRLAGEPLDILANGTKIAKYSYISSEVLKDIVNNIENILKNTRYQKPNYLLLCQVRWSLNQLKEDIKKIDK